MLNHSEILAVVMGLSLALIAFGVYRWRQHRRVGRIEAWISDYLSARYGELPNHLQIHCSDDPLWPVLVAFDRPQNGTRHSLRFSCAGSQPTYSLVSETEAPRP